MIYIGADHRGFVLKNQLVKKLQESGFSVIDLGNDHLDSRDDYVDFAFKVAESVVADQGSKGIILCGSGAGMDMAANKVPGIRSALVFDAARAKQAREHEDANVISLPADVLETGKAWEIVQTFLKTNFSGDIRHKRRLSKMETLQGIWKKIKKTPVTIKDSKIEQVAIFGFADAKENSSLYKETYKVAYELAKAGYSVVDGGGPGVMKAASTGAKAAGGKVVGVTFYPNEAEHFEGRCLDNPLDVEIETKNYLERTLTLLKEGQVYVIFNGATGTLSEFAMAWGLARLYFGHHKPLILYGKFWKKIMKTLKENMLIRPEENKVYKIVSSPREVLGAIQEFEKEIEAGEHKYLTLDKDEEAFLIPR